MRESSGFASFAQVRLRGGFELLGPVVRLQVQTAPLKRGDKPHQWYDPAPIRSIRHLRLDAGGATGIDDDTGEPIGDVHHRDHPLSRFRGENGLSIGFTSHYDLMRAEFGDHLTDGIAGESILIASDRRIEHSTFEHGIVVMTAIGMIAIDELQVAAPCVEFSKYSLRYPSDKPADVAVSNAVTFLHQGMRGYYGTLGDAAENAIISLGDLVYRRES
jgi:hypothetical protein